MTLRRWLAASVAVVALAVGLGACDSGGESGRATDAPGTPVDVGAEPAYAALPAPKRLVMIDDAGHGEFADSCFDVDDRDESAPDPSPESGSTGCDPEVLDPATAVEVIQHLTVAHLRDALGIDDPPVGLGDSITTAFDGVTMEYEHAP